MANLAGLIDYNAKPESQFDALPSGEYPAVITDSNTKATKAGTGTYLELTYQIVDGPYKGRMIWARLNIVNQKVETQNRGQSELAKVRHAVGHMGDLPDSQMLHNIPHLIRVEHKPASGGYGESNEIKDWKAFAGAAAQAPKPAQPAAPQTPAPAAANGGGLPWQRNAA